MTFRPPIKGYAASVVYVCVHVFVHVCVCACVFVCVCMYVCVCLCLKTGDLDFTK